MKIRAHHLLCAQSFNGKGYNKNFVDNFRNVLVEIQKNKIISIINYPDDICSACPHNGNGCKKEKGSEKKIKEKDNKIMRILGLIIGAKIKSRSALEQTKKAFSKAAIKKICKDCEWLKICLKSWR